MKKLLIILLSLLAFGCGSPATTKPQTAAVKPQTTKTEVKTRELKTLIWYPFGDYLLDVAHQENKYIFIFLYSDGCMYCDDMERETLSDPIVQDFLADSFISTRINVSQDPQSASVFYLDGNVSTPKSVFVDVYDDDSWKFGEVAGLVERDRMLRIILGVNEYFVSERQK